LCSSYAIYRIHLKLEHPAPHWAFLITISAL
jgi:hypothetical protein